VNNVFREQSSVVSICTNYFPMVRDTGSWKLYQYRVEFAEEVASKRRRMGMVLKNLKERFRNEIAYDGENDLFARDQLPDNVLF
jgi:hypothetical protein